MLDPHTIHSGGTAFIAGLVTSLHCVGMCGPLAIVLSPKKDESVSMEAITTVYNLTRILSITAMGAALGALGEIAMSSLQASPVQYVPWLLVIFFVLVGIGADKWLPKPRILTKWFYRISARFQKLPRLTAGGLIGGLTPLLPCGPLYMVFGLALALGSPLQGAEFLFAFGLGTLPLLFLSHIGWGRLSVRISPLWLMRFQRGLALAMALMLVWRLRAAIGVAGPDVGCPLCH